MISKINDVFFTKIIFLYKKDKNKSFFLKLLKKNLQNQVQHTNYSS